MTYHIDKPVNWRSIEKAEAALQLYYQSFPCRSAAVQREAERMIRELRASPQPNGTAPRLNDGEEYEHPRTGEAMLDGMTHPGL
jgi:hypothetical protein